MLTLSYRIAGGPVQSLHVPHRRCIIGRANDTDLSLAGWRVSRRHAEVFVSNDRPFVRDLGSSFGTFVNETRIEDAHPIGDDDEIRIGTHIVRVQWQSAGAQATEAERPVAAPGEGAPMARP